MKKEKLKNIFIIILCALMCGVIFAYQTRKSGLHEDEGYTLCSSVNPNNGVMDAYDKGTDGPVWRTRDYVKNALSLSKNNILNFKALYMNQAYDNHPPLFYTLVHFSTLFFGGNFSLYSAFIVNMVAYILSLVVLIKILKLLGKDNLIFPVLILYGLCMGTISMVIFQRMYMWLTFFILLYFYMNLKLYKNNFIMDKKFTIQLGFTTVLGFLTQYFFAIYAFFIFVLMLIKMIRDKKDADIIRKYIFSHICYAVIGILIFVPCIKHLLFSDRGVKNLENGGYLTHVYDYIKHLAYAFNIGSSNLAIITAVLILFVFGIIMYFVKADDRFIALITVLPSIFYFFVAVKMTSFQELRYVMPMIPFIVLTFYFIFDRFITWKYKEILFTVISAIIVICGFVFSKPLFLYENNKEILDIAEKNNDKSFVYIYDNFFNHMQSVQEMMIYKKSLIVNVNNNDELKYVINDQSLKDEKSFVLSIKNYMNNDEILDRIKNETDFKNVTVLYKAPNGLNSEVVNDNLYLISI